MFSIDRSSNRETTNCGWSNWTASVWACFIGSLSPREILKYNQKYRQNEQTTANGSMHSKLFYWSTFCQFVNVHFDNELFQRGYETQKLRMARKWKYNRTITEIDKRISCRDPIELEQPFFCAKMLHCIFFSEAYKMDVMWIMILSLKRENCRDGVCYRIFLEAKKYQEIKCKHWFKWVLPLFGALHIIYIIPRYHRTHLCLKEKTKFEKINYSELFDTQQHSIASKTKKFAFVFSFALGFLEPNQLNGITYGTSIGHNYLFGNR